MWKRYTTYDECTLQEKQLSSEKANPNDECFIGNESRYPRHPSVAPNIDRLDDQITITYSHALLLRCFISMLFFNFLGSKPSLKDKQKEVAMNEDLTLTRNTRRQATIEDPLYASFVLYFVEGDYLLFSCSYVEQCASPYNDSLLIQLKFSFIVNDTLLFMFDMTIVMIITRYFSYESQKFCTPYFSEAAENSALQSCSLLDRFHISYRPHQYIYKYYNFFNKKI